MGAKARRLSNRPPVPSKGFEAMCKWVEETARWQAAMVEWGDNVARHARKCCPPERRMMMLTLSDPPTSPKDPWK
jgi:hypothetical protein